MDAAVNREPSPLRHISEEPGEAPSMGWALLNGDRSWSRTKRGRVVQEVTPRSQLQLLISRTDPWPPAVTETPHSFPPNCCTQFNSQTHKTGLQLSSPSLGARAASSALAASQHPSNRLFPSTDEARCVSGERGPRRTGGRESLSPGAQGRQDTRGGPRRARVGAFQVGPSRQLGVCA